MCKTTIMKPKVKGIVGGRENGNKKTKIVEASRHRVTNNAILDKQ